MSNLYKMLVSSKQKFGRFVRPEREKIKLVERGGDGDGYDVTNIKDYLNDRVDSILEEFNMKREEKGIISSFHHAWINIYKKSETSYQLCSY